MKYDFELELNTNNSLSLITKKITPNSVILEFGPANGRLTQYLKEVLGCEVYIVELEYEAAKHASQFAEDFIIGDIERFEWLQKFNNISFDYIIFADVLEHLYNPQEVLKKATELLSDVGSILISVPNVAHNSVLIDLLNNKFEYRKIGLLDDTHIRFYTYQSLLRMIDNCDLITICEEATYKKVEETELENYYDSLPKQLHFYMKNRPYGEVYQYVFELKKKNFQKENQNLKDVNLKEKPENYFSQIYVDLGSGFEENRSTLKKITNFDNHLFEVNLDGFNQNLTAIRFDPINTNAIIIIEQIYMEQLDGNNKNLDFFTNAEYIIDNNYIFINSDPQISINNISNDDIKFIVKLSFKEVDFEFSNTVLNILNDAANFDKTIKEYKSKEITSSIIETELIAGKKELQSILYEKDEDINQLTVTLNELVTLISDSLNEKNEQINQLSSTINEKNEQIDQLTSTINQKNGELIGIYNSRSWKLTQIIKKYCNKISFKK